MRNFYNDLPKLNQIKDIVTDYDKEGVVIEHDYQNERKSVQYSMEVDGLKVNLIEKYFQSNCEGMELTIDDASSAHKLQFNINGKTIDIDPEYQYLDYEGFSFKYNDKSAYYFNEEDKAQLVISDKKGKPSVYYMEIHSADKFLEYAECDKCFDEMMDMTISKLNNDMIK